MLGWRAGFSEKDLTHISFPGKLLSQSRTFSTEELEILILDSCRPVATWNISARLLILVPLATVKGERWRQRGSASTGILPPRPVLCPVPSVGALPPRTTEDASLYRASARRSWKTFTNWPRAETQVVVQYQEIIIFK